MYNICNSLTSSHKIRRVDMTLKPISQILNIFDHRRNVLFSRKRKNFKRYNNMETKGNNSIYLL